MVRSYSRHGPVEAFGTIATNLSNSLFDGKVAWVPANEDVIVWNMKKGEMLAVWHEQGVISQVTCIARSPNKKIFAVGYQDGSIRIWDSVSKSVAITFNGHRKAVTSLAFDGEGVRLASGSQDTDIILWDVSAEVGLFKLRGHRDQVTALEFVHITSAEQIEGQQASTSNLTVTTPVFEQHLLSSSKDTLVKLWDCSTQHCVSTIVAHRGQVWSMTTFVDPSTQRNIVITGGGEGEAKAWWIDSAVPSRVRLSTSSDTDTRALKSLVDGLLPLATLSHAHRIAQIAWHPDEQLLALQTSERAVEILRLRSEEELRKKVARRRKREREKKKDGGDNAADSEMLVPQDSVWKDRLASWVVVRSSHKIRSFAFGVGSANLKGEVNMMIALNNNALEVHQLPAKPTKGRDKSEEAAAKQAVRQYAIELPGHRTDVRAMALSSDDELLGTASHGQLKIWNIKTTKCLRTMDCGYAICMTFLPGDRHVIIGTKAGELLLYDIGSSTLLETFFAHTKTVWSLAVRPDGKGIVTGSEDKDVKFWEFEVKDAIINADEVDAPPAFRKVLSMTHVKTLKMTEDVLAVKYSPNSSFLAVALLDMTVKIFYADTLKFFLSLYGHRLPVLSIDISSDSKLIITSSADKNVKIWGLDFGDCHRSLFAHDDSVMQVQFEKGTHFFWSVGKDRLVKYWDADKFQCIQKLEGHHGEVWALAVSNQGRFVATAAHDKSIRIWEKLDEPLFLEEERERELEAVHDANVERDRERDELRAVKEGEVLTEAVVVSKTTNESLTAGERIIEALEIAQEDRAAADAHDLMQSTMTEEARLRAAPRSRNAIFTIYSQDIEPEVHVLRIIQKINPAALNDAMLVLPFSQVTVMLHVLDYWASKSINIPLTSRILMFLLKTHASQIIATRAMRSTVLSIRRNLDEALSLQKNTIGYNMAALKHIKRQGVVQRTNEFYEKAGFGEEVQVQAMLEESVKKRKRAVVV